MQRRVLKRWVLSCKKKVMMHKSGAKNSAFVLMFCGEIKLLQFVYHALELLAYRGVITL